MTASGRARSSATLATSAPLTNIVSFVIRTVTVSRGFISDADSGIWMLLVFGRTS